MKILKFKSILLSSIFLFTLPTANAAFISAQDGSQISNLNNVTSTVLNVDDITGNLMGAFNIDIAGVIYDVAFIDDSFRNVFGDASGLDVTDLNTAMTFATALNDSVFVDVGQYNFDSDPSATFGCRASICLANIPYEFSTLFSSWRMGVAFNSFFEGSDRFANKNFSSDFNLITSISDVYADFSLSSDRVIPQVSEPPMFAIFSLILLGLLRFVRKSQKSSL